jgi:hypothetical protein
MQNTTVKYCAHLFYGCIYDLTQSLLSPFERGEEIEEILSSFERGDRRDTVYAREEILSMRERT